MVLLSTLPPCGPGPECYCRYTRRLHGLDNPYSALHQRPWISGCGRFSTFDELRLGDALPSAKLLLGSTPDGGSTCSTVLLTCISIVWGNAACGWPRLAHPQCPSQGRPRRYHPHSFAPDKSHEAAPQQGPPSRPGWRVRVSSGSRTVLEAAAGNRFRKERDTAVAKESRGVAGGGGCGGHHPPSSFMSTGLHASVSPRCIRRDTLCSCEAYGMRPLYKGKQTSPCPPHPYCRS